MKNYTFISNIAINNFRNYESVVFNFPKDKQFIIITGANGIGKTNILEAISLFSPGKGLRKADHIDLKNIESPNLPWGISIQLEKDDMPHKLGTGILSANSPRRVLKINEEKIKSRTMLKEYLSVIWLTPQIDKIFIESKSIRRNFFDKLMVELSPELSNTFFEYSRAMKERTKILKDGINDPTWVLNLEKAMIEKGIIISQARINFCKKLNTQIQKNNISSFPKGKVNIVGRIEELLNTNPNIDEIKDILSNDFLINRQRDTARGGASIGAHKSNFTILYLDKDMPANLCSTGEQKALLISTFLSFAHEMKDRHKQAPIILLDELIAHLDENRKHGLFGELEKLNSQVFITGTEKELFEKFKEKSKIVDL